MRNVLNNNLNILNIMDSNKEGLVAICEDMELSLYAGSQFFEDVYNNKLEKFPFTNNGNQLNKVSSQKLSFQPLQALFNPV